MLRSQWLIMGLLTVVFSQACTGDFSGGSKSASSVSEGSTHFSSYNGGGGINGKMIDASTFSARADGYGYTYGPSMIEYDGQYFVYGCTVGTGDNDWDHIFITSTQDFVHTAPVGTLIRPHAEGSACDPSVVRADDGYFYMFYDGLIHNVQTLLFVARATHPAGPWARYTTTGQWAVDAPDAKGIVLPFVNAPDVPEGVAAFYGAGEPMVVYRNGSFYMWYIDDSIEYPIHGGAKMYLRTSGDAINWTQPVPVNLDFAPTTDQGDIKLDPVTNTFVMFTVEDFMADAPHGVVHYSKDGVFWSEGEELCPPDSCLGKGANNPGLASDYYGHLKSHDVQIAYGANPDLITCDRNCWGRWDLYSSHFSIDESVRAFDRGFNSSFVKTVSEGFFKVGSIPTIYLSNGVDAYCAVADIPAFLAAGGRSDGADVRQLPALPSALKNVGTCGIRSGFFQVNSSGAIFNSNGKGGYCGYANLDDFAGAGGNDSNIRHYPALPSMIVYTGNCRSIQHAGFFASGSGIYMSNGAAFCGFRNTDDFMAAGGPSNGAGVPRRSNLPTDMHNDGFCSVNQPAGMFKLNTGAIFYSNGHSFCGFTSMVDYKNAGGPDDMSKFQVRSTLPTMQNDGMCKPPQPAGYFKVGGGILFSNGSTAYCAFVNWDDYKNDGGPDDTSAFPVRSSPPAGMGNAGVCKTVQPAGFFRLPSGTVFFSNGSTAYCGYTSFESYINGGGPADLSQVILRTSLPATMANAGACK